LLKVEFKNFYSFLWDLIHTAKKILKKTWVYWLFCSYKSIRINN
jgi:hypothetical protein